MIIVIFLGAVPFWIWFGLFGLFMIIAFRDKKTSK